MRHQILCEQINWLTGSRKNSRRISCVADSFLERNHLSWNDPVWVSIILAPVYRRDCPVGDGIPPVTSAHPVCRVSRTVGPNDSAAVMNEEEDKKRYPFCGIVEEDLQRYRNRDAERGDAHHSYGPAQCSLPTMLIHTCRRHAPSTLEAVNDTFPWHSTNNLSLQLRCGKD